MLSQSSDCSPVRVENILFRYPLNRLAAKPRRFSFQNTTLRKNSEIEENTNCVSFLKRVCRFQIE